MAYSIPLEVFEEGQQAEEYKARKAKEVTDIKKAEEDKYGPGKHRNANTLRAIDYRKSLQKNDPKGAKESIIKTEKISDKANASFQKHLGDKNYHLTDFSKDYDAIAKHDRRHPDRKIVESFSLFENVLFI